MNFISGLFSTIVTGGQNLLAKAGVWVVVALAVAAAGVWAYFYIHGTDEALASAQSALAAAQKQMAVLQSANTQDAQVISALRNQQQQSAAAEGAMNGRDQSIATITAAIESTIASDSANCAAHSVISVPGSSSGKDGPIAGVLADTLGALAKAQAAGGKS